MQRLLTFLLILATGLAPAATFRVTDLEVGGGYGESNTEIGNDGGLTVGSDGQIQTDGNVTIGGTLDVDTIQANSASGQASLNLDSSPQDGSSPLYFRVGRFSQSSNTTRRFYIYAADGTGNIVFEIDMRNTIARMSGRLDVSETIEAGSGNTTLTSATGELLHAAVEQNGATDGQVLSWNNTAGNWEPADAGSGGVSGTGSSSQIAYWSDSSTITGSSGMTWSGTRLDTSGIIQAGSGNEDITDAAGKLQQTAIEQDGASTDDVLTWNGTRWNPEAVSVDAWSETTLATVGTTISTSGATLVILNDDTASVIEIINGGSEGQHVVFVNLSSSVAASFQDESASSEGSANIKLTSPSPLSISQNQTVELVYVGDTGWWHEVS